MVTRAGMINVLNIKELEYHVGIYFMLRNYVMKYSRQNGDVSLDRVFRTNYSNCNSTIAAL